MSGKIFNSIKRKVDKEGDETYIVNVDFVCDSFEESVEVSKEFRHERSK